MITRIFKRLSRFAQDVDARRLIVKVDDLVVTVRSFLSFVFAFVNVIELELLSRNVGDWLGCNDVIIAGLFVIDEGMHTPAFDDNEGANADSKKQDAKCYDAHDGYSFLVQILSVLPLIFELLLSLHVN